jgi:integrase
MAIWQRTYPSGKKVYEFDYFDASGKRHRDIAFKEDGKPATKKSEVDEIRSKKVTECGMAPELLGDPNLTVEQFGTQWLKRLEGSDLKPRTIESYTQLYNNHLAPALGPIRLRDLRRTHIKELLSAKRDQVIVRSAKKVAPTDAQEQKPEPAPKTLSKNTVRLIRACLSAMLAEAMDDELIKSNPAAVPSRRRGKKGNGGVSAAERQKAIRPFSDAESTKVLKTAREQDAEHYPLFLLLGRTGMRPGEAFALQWPDFDFTNRKILVERAYSAGVLGTTKTDGVRTVDMSQELATALTALYKQREAQALKEGWGEVPELVFINSARKPMDESRVRKRFARVLKNAKITGHRLYDLRHTFATQLLAKSAPITYVAAQLGHARPSTTLQWYARWMPQMGAGFVDRLDAPGAVWHQSGTDQESTEISVEAEIEKGTELKGDSGGPFRARTGDPLIKSQLLYQLS